MKTIYAIMLFLAFTIIFIPNLLAQNLSNKKMLSLGYNFSVDNSKPDANSKDINDRIRNTKLGIDLSYGKFVTEKRMRGVSLYYQLGTNKSSNDYSSDNSSKNERNAATYNNSISLSYFMREHFELIDKKLYWWLQPIVGYNVNYGYTFSENNSIYNSGGNMYTSKSSYKKYNVSNGIHASISTGLTYFLNKRIAFTTGISLANGIFNYNTNTSQSFHNISPTDASMLGGPKSTNTSWNYSGSCNPSASISNMSIGINLLF